MSSSANSPEGDASTQKPASAQAKRSTLKPARKTAYLGTSRDYLTLLMEQDERSRDFSPNRH